MLSCSTWIYGVQQSFCVSRNNCRMQQSSGGFRGRANSDKLRQAALQVERYIFFPACAERFGLQSPGLLREGRDEDGEQGMLHSALQVLQKASTPAHTCGSILQTQAAAFSARYEAALAWTHGMLLLHCLPCFLVHTVDLGMPSGFLSCMRGPCRCSEMPSHACRCMSAASQRSQRQTETCESIWRPCAAASWRECT